MTCGPSEKTKKLIDDSKKIFGTIPDKMPGGESDTSELILLGEKLYFEKDFLQTIHSLVILVIMLSERPLEWIIFLHLRVRLEKMESEILQPF
ncbi:hypothetical protein LEP1GSC170_4309 [Leptospira interrogans serovar Bataviae str. HAI135]|nr:hypothetical protein LEP1GSC170_4309 [Leptospira interrogans serovar Bataviae str. HAI135]